MKYYEVDFNALDYEDCSPKGPITVGTDNEAALKTVKEYLSGYWSGCYKEPIGLLKEPFLVPGAHYNDLWDWDSFFMACAVPDEGIQYGKGSAFDLASNINKVTGKPTKKASASGYCDYYSHPYPLQTQFAYIMARRMNDFSWVEPLWNNFMRMEQWFEKYSMKDGYYVWSHSYGNGIDNNPAVYGRPAMTSAGIDLASWHYRELRALEKLAGILNKDGKDYYRQKAEALKTQVQEKYWDDVDKLFYNIDCTTEYATISLQSINWVLHMKYRSWASLFPLWGKVATPEQAKYVRDKIMSEDEYLSCCGVRSHSKNDMVYNNVAMGNPSNWQGPVWGLSTFVTAYGLARYGYQEEALDVAFRLIRTFAADIEQNGCLHEFYHGDTGQPIINPGFLSWNILALRVVDDIRSGQDCTTLDLLDD